MKVHTLQVWWAWARAGAGAGAHGTPGPPPTILQQFPL